MSRAQAHRSLPHVETNNSKLFTSKVKKYDTKRESLLSDCISSGESNNVQESFWLYMAGCWRVKLEVPVILKEPSGRENEKHYDKNVHMIFMQCEINVYLPGL